LGFAVGITLGHEHGLTKGTVWDKGPGAATTGDLEQTRFAVAHLARPATTTRHHKLDHFLWFYACQPLSLVHGAPPCPILPRGCGLTTPRISAFVIGALQRGGYSWSRIRRGSGVGQEPE